MVSVEERMKVLNLLQTGAITAEQAAQLLQAMDSGRADPSAAPSGESSAWDDFPGPAGAEPYTAPEPPVSADYSSDQPAEPDQRALSMPAPAVAGSRARWLIVRVSDMKTGRPRVNVRLPLSLVGFGLKMGRQFAPQLEGMDVSELASILQTGEPGPYVDVYDEDDGEHVEVFLE